MQRTISIFLTVHFKVLKCISYRILHPAFTTSRLTTSSLESDKMLYCTYLHLGFLQACNRMNFTCVPLYDSLGENAIEFILNHAECVAAFCQTEKLPALAKALDKTKQFLKAVVYWGAGNADAIKVMHLMHLDYEGVTEKVLDQARASTDVMRLLCPCTS